MDYFESMMGDPADHHKQVLKRLVSAGSFLLESLMNVRTTNQIIYRLYDVQIRCR